MNLEELGALSDEYWEVYNERLKADKVAAALKVRENELYAAITQCLRENELTAIGGQKVRLEMKTEFVPAIKDWSRFYEHIQKTGEFDLLEKRPGKVACRARWDLGEEVPGVERFPVYKLSKSEVK